MVVLHSLDKLQKPNGVYARQSLLHVMNIFKFPQEPLVDVSHLPDLIDTVALMESRCDGKYALVSRVDQLSIDIPYKVVLIK